MPARAILLWPDRRLRMRAAAVEEVADEVRAAWEDMLETMYAMPGVGLAAPQIGIMWRLAVVDCSDAGRAPVRLANPVLLEASDERFLHTEASPCLPGVSAPLTRSRAVKVGYLDEDGTPSEREFTDLWSTSVQHQIDHLDGWLFVHRLGEVKRKMLIERSKKLQARGMV